MATHSSIFAWRIHGKRSLVGYSPWGCRVGRDRMTNTSTFRRCWWGVRWDREVSQESRLMSPSSRGHLDAVPRGLLGGCAKHTVHSLTASRPQGGEDREAGCSIPSPLLHWLRAVPPPRAESHRWSRRGVLVCAGRWVLGPHVCPVTVTGVGPGRRGLVCSGAWVLGPCVCPVTVTGAGAAVHAVLHTLACLLFTGEESREEAACRGHAARAVAMLVVEPELLIKAVSDLRNTYKAASLCLGFPGGSDGKESACNVETWVGSLGWEDPWEEGMTTTPVFFCWCQL